MLLFEKVTLGYFFDLRIFRQQSGNRVHLCESLSILAILQSFVEQCKLQD